jgi:membrane-bound inhibitor of C-type lysozyme
MTGDFERKTVGYGCTGIEESLSVDYLNAAPNYLAMIPIDGSVLLFNTVLAGSGAKYVSGKYVWWTKGTDGSLYDLTEGPNAKPILTCSEVNNTP